MRIVKRGLPIGNLTSQFFANVYLNPLDHFVKHELRVKGYVRYMDDFLLFGDDRAALQRQGRQVRQKLAELRLEIHPDKYRLVPTEHRAWISPATWCFPMAACGCAAPACGGSIDDTSGCSGSCAIAAHRRRR